MFLSLCLRHVKKRKLTFVLQRVRGSYLHSSANGLSRAVNHLVVGKSNVKFLKLAHGSAPFRSTPQPLCV